MNGPYAVSWFQFYFDCSLIYFNFIFYDLITFHQLTNPRLGNPGGEQSSYLCIPGENQLQKRSCQSERWGRGCWTWCSAGVESWSLKGFALEHFGLHDRHNSALFPTAPGGIMTFRHESSTDVIQLCHDCQQLHRVYWWSAVAVKVGSHLAAVHLIILKPQLATQQDRSDLLQFCEPAVT